MRFTKLAQALCCALIISAPAFAGDAADHKELQATLVAPFLSAHGEARDFALQFQYQEATDPSIAAWKLELVSPEGKTLVAQGTKHVNFINVETGQVRGGFRGPLQSDSLQA